MSAIQNLPEELISKIISELQEKKDIKQCQHVCRAWYVPAHTFLLSQVFLKDPKMTRQFIESLDYNPDPKYLAAVRFLNVYNMAEPAAQFDIQKLFLRFPNLNMVVLDGHAALLEGFTEQVCKDMLTSCPKLKIFDVVHVGADQEHLIYNVRLLLTSITVTRTLDLTHYGKIFRCLEDIDKNSITFGRFLPILKQLPNLKTLHISDAVDDRDQFAEKFMFSLPSDKQHQFAKQLSAIDTINLATNKGICANSIKFMSNTLSGLERFVLRSSSNKTWTNLEEQVFCNNLLDLISPKTTIELKDMNFMVLSKLFPVLAHRVFDNTPSSTKKLYISILDGNSSDITANLGVYVDKSSSNRKIRVQIKKQLRLGHVAYYLCGSKAPLHEVDVLKIYFKFRDESWGSPPAEIDMYYALLAKMPSLKKLILDIPDAYDEFDTKFKTSVICPKVEDAIIRASEALRIRQILDGFSTTFPNLKRLSLYYFSGDWDYNSGVFFVDLPKYSLEKLEVDVTPIKRMKIEISVKKDFFVLEIEQLLYKVPYDLSSCTEISEQDVKGLVPRKDYIRLRVVTKKLQTLCLYVKVKDVIDDCYMNAPVLKGVKRLTIQLN